MKKQKFSAEEADLVIANLEVERLKKWHVPWQDKPWLYALVSTIKKLPVIIGVALIFKMHEIGNFFSNPALFFSERWYFLLSGFIILLLYHRIVWNNHAFSYFLYANTDPALPQPASGSALVKRGRKVSARLPGTYEAYRQKRLALMLGMGILAPFVFLLVLFLIYFFTGSIRNISEFEGQFDPGILPLLIVIFFIAGVLLGHGIWKGIVDQYRLLQKAKLQL